MKNTLLDAATVVGCCVGVGFLSGKEAQIYFGGKLGVVIFALCFCLINLILRNFCLKNHCQTVAQLANCCFGKLGKIFTATFSLCCFVSIVTMLAGLEQTLQTFAATTQKFPVYATLAAIISATVAKCGWKTLKALNALSVLLALVYLAILLFSTPKATTASHVSAVQPLKYALFSTTMSLGVITPLANSNKRQNISSTLIATIALCLLISAVLYIGDFSLALPILGKPQSHATKILGAATVTLCTTTGIVANAMPITESLFDLFDQDKSLTIACIFTLAVALSMFGFDFALRFGYLFVAAVGTVIVVTAALKTLKTAKNAV